MTGLVRSSTTMILGRSAGNVPMKSHMPVSKEEDRQFLSAFRHQVSKQCLQSISPSASSWREKKSLASSSPLSWLPFKAKFSTKFQSTWMAWRWRCPWNDPRANFNSYSIPGLFFYVRTGCPTKTKFWGPLNKTLKILLSTFLGHHYICLFPIKTYPIIGPISGLWSWIGSKLKHSLPYIGFFVICSHPL